MAKLTLQVFRDGHKREHSLGGLFSFSSTIPDDKQGNYAALAIGARMVKEDAPEPDIRAFVLREIVGSVKGHDYKGEIQACFEFARDCITYRKDPAGVERVADLWSTMYALNPAKPEGDCLIKSIALCTALASIGHRCFFIPMQQTPDEDSFNHVYVGVYTADGEDVDMEGQRFKSLDPTPEDAEAGWKARAAVRMLYPIKFE
jgi:hypothetical protein